MRYMEYVIIKIGDRGTKMLTEFWHDSVWSKVIAAGIIALTGGIIAYFNIDIKTLITFFKQYYKDIIIIILSLILIIILLIHIIREKNKKKPNIIWLKYFTKSHTFVETTFLLWFPLNGIMKSPHRRLTLEDEHKLLYSRKIKPLFDKNIIYKGEFGVIEINEKAYDVLDKFLKKNVNKTKKTDAEILSYIKNTDFHEQLFKCATYTEYDENMGSS